MSSQHRLNGTTVRPEPDELDAARPHLAGRSLESALRALLRAVAAEPQRSLDLLAPYWPP
ncbi:MAG: hypothetical protein HOY71_11315, partial [Nonomuraea sp.]|nr:hypothetical protein [Nonomuraea sp.]